MSKTQYTITTTGNTTVIHREGPARNLPLAKRIGFRQDEGDTRALPVKPKRAPRRGKKKGR
jgi:hypothetical protein